MAQLNYKNFDDNLHTHLKLAAVKAKKPMREYVFSLLTEGSGYKGKVADRLKPGPKPTRVKA
jgi:hypothetical protein